MRLTGDRRDGRLLGAQLVAHHSAQVAKRADIAAMAIHAGWTVDALSDADLAYSRRLGAVGCAAARRPGVRHRVASEITDRLLDNRLV
jgi:hypothetical protein